MREFRHPWSRMARASVVLAVAIAAAACDADAGSDETAPAVAEDDSGSATDSNGAAEGGDTYIALCPEGEGPDSLVFSVWGGHDAELGDAVQGFTDLTGVEIEFLVNGTGDRLTKLNAERGAPTIDVALVPVNEVFPLLDNGVVMAEDTSVPNYESLEDVAKVAGGYGVSQLQLVLAYNPEHVTEEPTSWMDLFDDAYRGHIQFPTVPSVGGYGALAVINEALGGDVDNLTPAIEQLAEAKDGIVDFYDFGPANYPLVESGEVWMYPEISGVVQQYADGGGSLEYVVPDEGGPVGMNVAVVPEGVASEGCAKAFVGWLLDEDVQTTYSQTRYYQTVNTTVDIPDEVAEFVYPVDASTVFDVDWETIQSNAADIIDQWNRMIAN